MGERMSEENTTETTTENEAQESTAPTTLEEALALLDTVTQNEAKWKALSKKNEDNYKATSKRLEDLEKSQMTDAEKALDAARAEGRTSALSEVGKDLVNAEMAIQAVAAGVKLPDTQYLNMTTFLGEDGRPNKDAVKTFVESLPKAQAFAPLQGAGAQPGGAPTMESMDPNELADYISGGSFI